MLGKKKFFLIFCLHHKINHQSSNIVTIQMVLNALAGVICREKQIKVIRIRKEETNCIYMNMMWFFYAENIKTTNY